MFCVIRKIVFIFAAGNDKSHITMSEINQTINLHVSVGITQEEARGRFDLQRLPDDASQTVRIVKVGDYDECLCIGTHVANTAEIGTFRIISHDWDEAEKRWRIRFKHVSPA